MMRGMLSVIILGVLLGASFFAYRGVVRTAATPLLVTQDEIRRLDTEAFRLVARARLSEDAAFALYERLARLEAEYITRLGQRGDALEGSIAPLAERVLCDALPNQCVYIWKTFDDYRAQSDVVVRADIDMVLRGDAGAGSVPSRTVPSLFSLEDEQARYAAMISSRTAPQARAALIWYAGEGTRRTPGIITDLVSGYLALDKERSVVSFAQVRAEILSNAYRTYRAAEASSDAYSSPQEDGSAFPSSLAALRDVVTLLQPYLTTQGIKDIDAELLEARNALWWSGAYYEYALSDAMTVAAPLP